MGKFDVHVIFNSMYPWRAVFFMICILLCLYPSLIAWAASTTILEKNSESAPISLLDIQVLAAFIKQSSPSSSTLINDNDKDNDNNNYDIDNNNNDNDNNDTKT